MNDVEMVSLLEKQLNMLEEAGAQISGDREFFNVGEWLLAFEGVYVMNRKMPGILKDSDIKLLIEYFGEDMSDLNP